MADLKIIRNRAGQIVEIREAFSVWDILRGLPLWIAVTSWGAVDLMNGHLAFNPLFGKAEFPSRLLLIGSALTVLSIVMVPFRRLRRLTIANTKGIRLRFYPEIGIIPWSAVSGFHLISASSLFIGTWALVADLKNPDAFIGKLKRRRQPPEREPPPLGTIAGDDNFDLAALRTALDELWKQVGAT